jgi:ABC-2 type transport system ATP-binding protein
VIVIDHGKLIHDGDLKALVRRVRPDKRLTLRLSAPVDLAVLEKIATVVSYEGGQAVLSVSPEKLNATVQNALATLPVADLAVEDPPLEEVMREMFKGQPAIPPDAARLTGTDGGGAP